MPDDDDDGYRKARDTDLKAQAHNHRVFVAGLQKHPGRAVVLAVAFAAVGAFALLEYRSPVGVLGLAVAVYLIVVAKPRR